jgi:hypothetical protein
MAMFTIKVPNVFVQDCIDCCCDIGDYDGSYLRCDHEQLAELRNRAEFYADDGTDSAYHKRAAKALLAALERRNA